MTEGKTVGLLGRPMRDYVDAAELPWFYLSLVLTFIYVGSFWLDVSYLSLMAPLTLIAQVITAVVVAYVASKRRVLPWQQVLVTCGLVGLAGGVVAGLLALVRFWYWWLFFNLFVEPVWSAALAMFVGALTLAFFHLPVWVRQLRGTDKQKVSP